MLSSDLPYPLFSNSDDINITEEVDIVVILLYMIYIMSVRVVSKFSADVLSSVALLSWFYINLNSVTVDGYYCSRSVYFQEQKKIRSLQWSKINCPPSH